MKGTFVIVWKKTTNSLQNTKKKTILKVDWSRWLINTAAGERGMEFFERMLHHHINRMIQFIYYEILIKRSKEKNNFFEQKSFHLSDFLSLISELCPIVKNRQSSLYIILYKTWILLRSLQVLRGGSWWWREAVRWPTASRWRQQERSIDRHTGLQHLHLQLLAIFFIIITLRISLLIYIVYKTDTTKPKNL